MTQEIRFCTFNIGVGMGDFNSMVSATEKGPAWGEKLTEANVQSEEEQQNLYNAVEKKTAEKIAELADVIALQEVYSIDRPFIETLANLGFELCLFTPEKGDYDTAIAVRSGFFEATSSDLPILKNGQQIAVITGTVVGGNSTFTFASIHSPGFQLYPENHENREENAQDKRGKAQALTYSQEVLSSVRAAGSDYSVIGGDMNNNLHNYQEQFNLFANDNYTVLEPDRETNANPYDAAEFNYGFRTIDYIFASKKPLLQRIWNVVTNFFLLKESYKFSNATIPEEFRFGDIDGLCSDHLPVITVIQRRATLSDLITKIKRFFSCSLFFTAQNEQIEEESV